jgi:uncharacterized Tic20 family protein
MKPLSWVLKTHISVINLYSPPNPIDSDTRQLNFVIATMAFSHILSVLLVAAHVLLSGTTIIKVPRLSEVLTLPQEVGAILKSLIVSQAVIV